MADAKALGGGHETRTTADVGLKAGAIGWVGAAVLGAVFLSPALGLYGNIGPIIGTAGNISPLIWLIAGGLAMLNATNYAMVSRRMPSAGSAFTWSWNLLNPRIGTWVGWMMLGYYITISITLPLLFGLFFNAFLGEFAVTTGYWTWALGVVICSAGIAFPVYRGIAISSRTALVFLVIETSVVVALSITLLVVRGSQGQLSLAPFNPGNVTGGSTTAFFLALVFGVFAYTGFETISVVAEETRAPKEKTPQATILAVLLVGVFWVFATYALSFALPVAKVVAATATDVTPVASMAAAVWGRGALIVAITGMTAAFAVFLASAAATSRVMYAQSREGTLPPLFRRVHRAYQTPWPALHAFFLVAVAGALIGAYVAGILNFYTWAVSATLFFGLIMYTSTAIANFLLHRNDKGANRLATAAVPLLAIALDGYLMYKFYFDVLWNSGFALGKSITIVCLGLAAIAVVAVLVLSKVRPTIFAKRGYVFGETTVEAAALDAGASYKGGI